MTIPRKIESQFQYLCDDIKTFMQSQFLVKQYS